LLLSAIPLALWALCQVQSRSSRRTVAILRDWWPLSWILIGYWAMGWFASPPLGALQSELVSLDRLLLNNANLQGLIEAAGSFFPAMLETMYLLLYAIPPLCLAILYACGERSQAPRFLLLVFAGTFTAYALLPYFPVISPRVAFPSADLPHYNGMARTVNTWLLDHLDISTGVLPSGHVAVAFSSALALADVFRARPWFGRCALGAAGLVFLATVYGRYHYSVDGLISIALVSVISRIASRIPHA
jgi:membrane-associated phospholipid phosphatase